MYNLQGTGVTMTGSVVRVRQVSGSVILSERTKRKNKIRCQGDRFLHCLRKIINGELWAGLNTLIGGCFYQGRKGHRMKVGYQKNLNEEKDKTGSPIYDIRKRSR